MNGRLERLLFIVHRSSFIVSEVTVVKLHLSVRGGVLTKGGKVEKSVAGH